ncbi:hypothetical protein HOD38_03715 [archaeon]|jgi:hypothetical protein|nr:hypothetical protein [archaeon]MBT4397348.1 hypothetical protein [archaeon]MBT4440728.1 hypothetical protein [archaeon]
MQGEYQEPRRLLDPSSLDTRLPPPDKSYTPPQEYRPHNPRGYPGDDTGKVIQNERAGIYAGFPYVGETGDNGMGALKAQFGGATMSYQ